MKRQNTQSVGAVIAQVLRENGLEKPLLEHRLIEAWPTLMGSLVQKYTGTIEIQNGVLIVQIKSAALRQELFIARHQLVERLNNEVGADIITDIRLRG